MTHNRTPRLAITQASAETHELQDSLHCCNMITSRLCVRTQLLLRALASAESDGSCRGLTDQSGQFQSSDRAGRHRGRSLALAEVGWA